MNAILVHGMVVHGRAGDKHYGAAAVEKPDNKALENCKELEIRTAILTKN